MKRFDMVEGLGFQLVTAADRFAHPTRRVTQLFQTNFTNFNRSRAGAGITCPPCSTTTLAIS